MTERRAGECRWAKANRDASTHENKNDDGYAMSRKMIILFVAEIAAVALLRVIHMVRRDKLFMPRSSKVDRVNRKPVYRQPHIAPKRRTSSLENNIRGVEIEGWTPEYVDGKIQSTPDGPPGDN